MVRGELDLGRWVIGGLRFGLEVHGLLVVDAVGARRLVFVRWCRVRIALCS